VYEVVRGDNLWTISRAHLAAASGRGPGDLSNREIANYWIRVIEVNRDRLRSGDPDLIYPGEQIELPPIGG
jgi:nucleoid-associated protein YgaU